MPDWLNWLAAITGILSFFIPVLAYFYRRDNKLEPSAAEAEPSSQVAYNRAIDVIAKKANAYRGQVW